MDYYVTLSLSVQGRLFTVAEQLPIYPLKIDGWGLHLRRDDTLEHLDCESCEPTDQSGDRGGCFHRGWRVVELDAADNGLEQPDVPHARYESDHRP